MKALLYPPLAVFDLTLWGATIVLAPIALPLALLMMPGGPEPID